MPYRSTKCPQISHSKNTSNKMTEIVFSLIWLTAKIFGTAILKKEKFRLLNDISDICLIWHTSVTTTIMKQKYSFISVAEKLQWNTSFYSLVLCLSWMSMHAPKDCFVVSFFKSASVCLCNSIPFRWNCSDPSRHMDLSISVVYISKQHCNWMYSLQISGWISPSSGLQ